MVARSSIVLFGVLLALLVFGVASAAAQPVDEAAGTPVEPTEPEPTEPAEPGTEDDAVAAGAVTGDYELRLNGLGDIPLQALPRDEAGTTGDLGQNFWLNQWLRLHGEAGIRDRLLVVGEVDVFDGIVLGDYTQGVEPAEQPRNDADGFGTIEPRALFLTWLTSIGEIRAGLMPSHWGLGILANDGAHDSPFGDAFYGDIVTRLAFGTRPLGRETPFTVAVGGDVVFNDITADFRDGETALLGIVAAYYGGDRQTVGVYGVYRSQRNEYDTVGGSQEDTLRVYVGDAYARWDTREPSGGRLFAAAEAALVYGKTTLFRTTSQGLHKVRQQMIVAQLGRDGDDVDFVLEGGWTSGDSNNEDAFQRRATMDPDHRVGLILFPEVIAWNTARSAALAQSDELFGRPAPGSGLLPTNGGVAGAMYLFPTLTWSARQWLEVRVGGVWAKATSAVIDPFAQRARSANVNYQGGDALARDLGAEVDGAVLTRFELPHGMICTAGIEGGWFVAGHAFDDANGVHMKRVGLVRARFGLRF